LPSTAQEGNHFARPHLLMRQYGMRTSQNNPYAGYTIDDWNWEFLKRNQRYKKAYKAVQWVKARLDRKAFFVAASLSTFGNAFGQQFRFTRVDRGNGCEWCYRGNGKQPIYLNDLSSRDNPSWRRYKGKLIKKLKPVTQIEAPWIDKAISSGLPCFL
jgi:hypothetical protein